MSKQYGLIVPEKTKKPKPIFQATRNVFGDESDSDNENKKIGLLRPSDNTKRQAKLTQEKALVEDPTVYQYDEIYDEMTTKKKEEKKVNMEDKKPRYIEKLLKTAQKRKMENERRLERQVQKEREKEGEEFADKEVFVTSAYKKKMEEMRQEEEKEKYEEYLESIGDVTKQKDLGGFYRHLYEQKLGQKSPSISETKDEQDMPITQEIGNTPEKPKNINEKLKRTTSKDREAESTKKGRSYRKRKSSSEVNKDLSEGEVVSEDEINRVNLDDIKAAKRSRNENDTNIDADSDFSIDESSDEEPKTPKIEGNIPISHTEEGKQAADMKSIESKVTEKVMEPPLPPPPPPLPPPPPPPKVEEPVETKPKVDIWKKRTVGEVLEQALKRYYERKAARYRNM